FMRRRFDCCRACKNRSAGNSSSLGCCRMIRCSTTGMAASPAPNRMAGLTNSMSAPRPTAEQVAGQRPIEPHAGVDRHVIYAALKALASVRLAEAIYFGDVVALEAIGVDLHSFLRL